MAGRAIAIAILLVTAATAGCGDDDPQTTTSATVVTTPVPEQPQGGRQSRVIDGDLDTPVAGATVAAFDDGRLLGPGTATGADGTWTVPAGATLAYARIEGRQPGYSRVNPERTDPVIVRLYDPALQNPEVGGGPTRTRYIPGVVIPTPSGPPTWRYRTTRPLGQPPAISNGLAILVDTDGVMIAIRTRNKATDWSVRIGTSGRGAMTTPTILQDEGRVLVSSLDRGLGSYDLSTGVLKQSFATGSNPLTTPPLVAGESVFVGSEAGRVYRLDRGLRLQCSFLADTAIVGTPALGAAGVVFADADGAVYAMDPRTCKELWRHRSGAAIADGPAITAGQVIAGNAAGRVFALNETTGERLWVHRAAGSVSAAPASDGETVYVGGRQGVMEALALPSGAVRWRVDVRATISGSATVVGPNVYFTGGSPNDSTVYAARRQDGRIVWQSPSANRTSVVAAGRTLFVTEPRALRAYRAS